MLNDDNWFEIMLHLDIALPSLALTSKQLYKIYQKHKNLLCDEGHYRLSFYQRQLIKDMFIHIDKEYNQKHPLLLQVNNNIGTKVAILMAAVKYKGTTVILTSKKENIKWQQEVKKLNYHILICAHGYCDRRLVQYGYTNHTDPNLMGYKVVIVNKGDCWEIAKHSLLIIHKIDKIMPRLSNNTILFSGKVKKLIKCDYIEYLYVKPILYVKDLCCYHDNPPELLLPPLQDDYLYKPLNERLDDLITNIITYDEGPYLIIGDSIHTSHFLKLNMKDLRLNDIIFISYHDFKNINLSKAVISIKTVIILWPGHSPLYKKVMDVLNHMNVYQLNIFYIHSTIEEKYLLSLNKNDVTLQIGKRTKIEFLSSIRTLSLKYDLNQLPLPTIYQLINSDG